MKIYSREEILEIIMGCEDDYYTYIVAAARILTGIIDGSKDAEEDLKLALWTKFMQAYTRFIKNNPDKVETITFDCHITSWRTGLREI